ncbi:hypothetical protein Tco_0619071, partial [Tanacetum coccineum]
MASMGLSPLGILEQLNLILIGKIQIVDQLREDIPIE